MADEVNHLLQIPCPVMVLDAQGHVRSVNDDLLAVMGESSAHWINQPIDQVFTPASRIFIQTHIWPMLLQQGRVREIYLQVRGNHDEVIPVMVNAGRGLYGGEPCYVWVFFVALERSRFEADLLKARSEAQRMAADLARANAELTAIQAQMAQHARTVEAQNLELAALSRTDPLTGLGNRRALETAVQAWRGAGGARSKVARNAAPSTLLSASVLLIDVDHFKTVNDGFGHVEGDRVLSHLARQLQSSARQDDQVIRFGGEEFAIWLPATDRAGAARIAQRVHDNVRAILAGDQPLTVSIGVATLAEPLPADALSQLLLQADLAVYAAKAAGRNCTVHAEDLGSPE